MKKITSCILLINLLLCAVTISVSADNRDLLVYIASGSSSAYRYHARANCSSLSRSVVAEVTLEEAAQRGFTACSRCHPPEPDFEVTVTPRPITEGSGGTYTRNSGGTYTENRGGTSTRNSTGSSTQTVSSSGTKRRGSVGERLAGFAFGSLVIFIVAINIWSAILERKAKKARQRQQQEEREQWEQDRAEYVQKFVMSSTLELSNAPTNCYVGEDGLPACRTGDGRWGDGYTVYMTGGGRAYHLSSCRVVKSNYAIPVNAYRAKTGYRWYNGEHGYCPCSYCRPVLPDMAWYEKYLEIRRIREKYDIPEPALKSEEESVKLNFQGKK